MTEWHIETGALGVLQVRGLNREFMRVGDRISTRREAYFLGTNALLAGGTEVLMGVGFGRHWNDGPVVGGATQFSGNNPVPVDAASENLGFFRVWSIPGRGDGTPQSEAIEVTERFTLSDDQARLDYLMTIVDPVYLSGPATFEAYYLALNQEYFAIECNVF